MNLEIYFFTDGKVGERFCSYCGRWVEGGKFCSSLCRDLYHRASSSIVTSRHAVLLRILDEENCRFDDPLRSLNYYEAILLGNDGLCIYDDAPLSEYNASGHALDRIDCGKLHTAANVVGPVCGFCNMLRRDLLSVEEFLMLKPILAEIREHREMMKPKIRR